MHIKIGPVSYSVIADVTRGKEDDLGGLIDYEERTIRLGTPGAESFVAVNLWHEILHLILRQAGSPIPAHAQEAAVRALAYGIVGVLQDNPRLGEVSTILATKGGYDHTAAEKELVITREDDRRV